MRDFWRQVETTGHLYGESDDRTPRVASTKKDTEGVNKKGGVGVDG